MIPNRWKELFNELDTDDSGLIDFSELRKFLQDAGTTDLIPILEDWMADYDVNGDGKLNYREFLGFVASL